MSSSTNPPRSMINNKQNNGGINNGGQKPQQIQQGVEGKGFYKNPLTLKTTAQQQEKPATTTTTSGHPSNGRATSSSTNNQQQQRGNIMMIPNNVTTTTSSTRTNNVTAVPQLLKNPSNPTPKPSNEKSTKLQCSLVKKHEEQYLAFLSDEGKIPNVIKSLSGEREPQDFCSLRSTCIQQYQNIALSDTEYDKKYDLILQIWKTFYYKLIELFRRNPVLKERKDLYIKFLNDSILEYKEFYKKISELFQKEKVLLQRGDLFRYKTLLNAKNMDFSKSEKYYKKAVQLSYNFGNAWNQLAVISTYQNDYFLAIYRYYRSLSCIHRPFKSARDNIILLFKNNVPKMKGKPSFKLLTLHGKLFQSQSTIEELDDDNLNIIEEIFAEVPENDSSYFFKATIMNLFVDQQNSNNYSKIFNEAFFAKLISHYSDLYESDSIRNFDIYNSLVLYIEYFLQNRKIYLYDNEALCNNLCFLYAKIVDDQRLADDGENGFYHDILGYNPLNGNLGTFSTRNENSNVKQSLNKIFQKQMNELINDKIISFYYREYDRAFSTASFEDDIEDDDKIDDESIVINGDLLDDINDEIIVDDISDSMTLDHQHIEPKSFTALPNNATTSTNGFITPAGGSNIWKTDSTSLPEMKNDSPSSLSKLNISSQAGNDYIEKPFMRNNVDSPFINDQLFNQRISTPVNNGLSSPIEKSNLMSKLLSSPPQKQSNAPSVYDSVFGNWHNGGISSNPQANWGTAPGTPFLGGFAQMPNPNVVYNPFGFSPVGYPTSNSMYSPPQQTPNHHSPPSHTSPHLAGDQSPGFIPFPFRDRKKNDNGASNTFNLFD
ncbi:predicted protein [Naegleria gruberi]|uniref:Predicted protein n=1 Tax=Naegleria gruberi TaxID=5762 RepID=D2VIS6_NAEGR|nr:uncharacterized protein NAEGRDRAFT_68780 [Naegleria gruberi]EFC43402.1 predicted protein [Naegleria gruberi]|eukprot:XP_002676146.1 predicted protein [Naegleria gruberi strain NEG-M]